MVKRVSWSDHTQTRYYGSRCKAPESHSETTIIPMDYPEGVADEIRKVTCNPTPGHTQRGNRI